MNRVTRRAVTSSRRSSEYFVAKDGFRISEEKPEINNSGSVTAPTKGEEI